METQDGITWFHKTVLITEMFTVFDIHKSSATQKFKLKFLT